MPDSKNSAIEVTLYGSIINFLLTVMKLTVGIIANSSALVADAVHSLSDLISDGIVIIGLRIAQKPEDEEHTYGHKRVETLITASIGIALFAVGAALLFNGFISIYNAYNGKIIEKPGILAFVLAVISIIIKEWLFRYTSKKGKELKSPAVVANAWHHRTDAFSSIGTSIGIGGAIILGGQWRILDPFAAIIVSTFIIKAAFDITSTAIDELIDCSLDRDVVRTIKKKILLIENVKDVHNFRSRKLGDSAAVEMHIAVDRSLSLQEAHDISLKAENIVKDFCGKDCIVTVHVDIYEE